MIDTEPRAVTEQEIQTLRELADSEINGVRVEEHHVAALLAPTRPVSAQALVDRLTDALHAADRRTRDDVAIMALRRRLRARFVVARFSKLHQ